MRLIREQEIVHGPELPLRSGAFGRFGRSQRVRMNRFQREVAICEQDLTVETLEKEFHRRRRLLAGGALEVPVLHHRDRSVWATEDVICGVNRLRKIGGVMCGHPASVRLWALPVHNSPVVARASYTLLSALSAGPLQRQ